MNELYILLLIAIGAPIVFFSVMPYVARRVLKSKEQPKVNAQCYECHESYDADCSAACRLPG